MSDRLLTIDVEAALAKVSMGRLRSRDQIPLALARCLASLAPKAIRLRLRRSRLQVEADCVPFSAETFDLILRLHDRRLDELERHAALEQLESLGLLDLLVAFTAGAKTVVVQSGPPVGLRLVLRSGRVVLDRLPDEHAFRGNALILNGLDGNPARQLGELDEHLRFAAYRVEVDRVRLDQGLVLEDVILQRSFAAGPVEGLVGLPSQGLAARTRLVVDGVVVRQIWDSPPSGAVWDAIVRCPPGFEKRALAEVSGQLGLLYRDIPRAFASLASESQERLRQLIYRLADCGAGESAVAGVPVFRRIGGPAVEASVLRIAAKGRLLRAIGPGVKASRYDLSGKVFVLDDRDRAFIERHLGLLVREPSRLPSQVSRLWSWIGRSRERLRRLFRGGLQKIALGKPVAGSALAPAERGFIEALQAALADGIVAGQQQTKVTFCRGGLVGWRWSVDASGTSWLRLGRANPAIKAMVRAVEADVHALFAALVLLGDGQAGLFPDREAAEALAGLTQAPRDTTFSADEDSTWR